FNSPAIATRPNNHSTSKEPDVPSRFQPDASASRTSSTAADTRSGVHSTTNTKAISPATIQRRTIRMLPINSTATTPSPLLPPPDRKEGVANPGQHPADERHVAGPLDGVAGPGRNQRTR